VLPLAIVAAFFWLQGQIASLLVGWLANTLVLLSVVAEVALIILWSRFVR
jgi:hypothetical protein